MARCAWSTAALVCREVRAQFGQHRCTSGMALPIVAVLHSIAVPQRALIVCCCLGCKTDLEWLRYAYIMESNLGEVVEVPKMECTLRKMVQWFLWLEMLAHTQPVLRTTLWVELTLTSDYEYNIDVHVHL